MVIGDLRDGPVSDAATTITERGLAESSAKWIEKGAVLLAMYGSIGKLGIAQRRLTTNQAIAFAVPSAIPPEYLFYYLLSSRGELASRGKGGTQQNISQTVIKAFPFVAAPLPEQHRIVEALDSYLSRLDAAQEALERVQTNLERYRACVLQAAVEGRLVPTEAQLAREESRDYEPASVLLKRVLAERRGRWEEAELAKMRAKGKEPNNDKWKAKYKEPVAPDVDALPELPEGWCWTSLDALSEIQGGIQKGKKRKPTDTLRSVPYLRVANVQRGYLDLSEVTLIDATDAEVERLRLEPGDVLFNEGGDRDKLGRGWVWSGELAECIHQNHVFRARPIPGGAEPRFLSWYGNTAGKQYFFDEAKQTVNLASLNLTKLRNLPVPLPPTAEMRRIVEVAEEQSSIEEAASDQLALDLRRVARLRQSVLKWAFEGKLVDQDPNDEPASALLDRIRAEREAATTPKKRTRKKRVK